MENAYKTRYLVDNHAPQVSIFAYTDLLSG